MKPLKYASREGLAAYGYEEYFRVQSVMVANRLQDTRPENRQSDTKQDLKKPNAFGQLLDEAREKLQNNQEMEGSVLGYNRNGATLFYQAAQREYKFR